MRGKHLVACLAAVFCMGGILCACQRQENAKEARKVSLELMVRKREDMESMRLVTEAFHRAQDEIEIVLNFVPNVDTELKIRAMEGTLPDLIQVNGLQARECMEFVQGGYFRDLTGEACMEQVRDDLLPYISYDGTMPFFPMTLSYEGIYVNEELMAEAGYEIPRTYEELIETACDIQSRGETAFLFSDRDDWSVRMCWENIETARRGSSKEFWELVAEGEASFETDPVTLSSLDRMKEIREFGQPNALQTGYDEAVSAYAAGEAYFFVQGSWCYQALLQKNAKLQLQLIPFPVADGEEQHVTFWADSNLAVSTQSSHPREALKFLEFLSNPENLEIYANAQHTFGCVEDMENVVPYADEVRNLAEQGKMVYEAVGLPGEVSRFRDESIQEILLDPSGEAQLRYLQEYTEKLREYGDDYLEMEGRTG